MLTLLKEKRPGVDQRAMAEFEKKHDVKIASQLKRILYKQNGGFLQENHVKTAEPTSYGFYFLEIYQLLPLEKWIINPLKENENPLFGKQIFFHEDKQRYIGFHFASANPEVVYVDFETLQVLKVGKDFNAFCNRLYYEPFTIEKAKSYPLSKLQQLLLTSKTATKVDVLTQLEDVNDKNWYLDWLFRLVKEGEVEASFSLFLNQLRYFRRKLPPNQVKHLLSLLKPRLTAQKFAELSAEWEGVK